MRHQNRPLKFPGASCRKACAGWVQGKQGDTAWLAHTLTHHPSAQQHPATQKRPQHWAEGCTFQQDSCMRSWRITPPWRSPVLCLSPTPTSPVPSGPQLSHVGEQWAGQSQRDACRTSEDWLVLHKLINLSIHQILHQPHPAITAKELS